MFYLKKSSWCYIYLEKLGVGGEVTILSLQLIYKTLSLTHGLKNHTTHIAIRNQANLF